MKENKEEKKIVEEEAIVINEKDIVNPEEVKLEETIEVEATEVIIEDAKVEENASNNEQGANMQVTEKEEAVEEVTSTGDTTEDTKGESIANPETEEAKKAIELVAILDIYYDQVLKIDITKGQAIADIYAQKGVKLTEARKKELIKAGVAELK